MPRDYEISHADPLELSVFAAEVERQLELDGPPVTKDLLIAAAEAVYGTGPLDPKSEATIARFILDMEKERRRVSEPGI